jgi:hypothetical protein
MNLNNEQIQALAARRIVNISYLESCMIIVGDLSQRKKLPNYIRKPLNRIYDQHYKVHGNLTLNDSESFAIQNHLTKLLSKEMDRMKDSLGETMTLEQYLLLGVELIQPIFNSMIMTDIRGVYPRSMRIEMVDFTPLINSMKSFINAGNKYLYQKKYVDVNNLHKIRAWGKDIISLYSDEVMKDIAEQAKQELEDA